MTIFAFSHRVKGHPTGIEECCPDVSRGYVADLRGAEACCSAARVRALV